MISPFEKQEIPGWVRWIAQDEDGSVWGYEAEPHMFDRGWYENEVGRSLKIGQVPPSSSWRNSLKRESE